MLFEILLSITFGILAGIITGLIPGIHINLICSILLIILPKYNLDIKLSICFIISMAITHTFLDTIPSIFLGAPDPNVCELILPAHKMLLKGNGFFAYILTCTGSLISLLFCIFSLYFFIKIIKIIDISIKNYIWIILILIIIFIIFSNKNKIECIKIYLISGILGLICFNINLEQPLFHLLSGLFGISGLLISIYSKNEIPEQNNECNFKKIIKPSTFATIMGFIAAFLPGFGTSQAAFLINKLTKINDEFYLILIGALSTSNMIFSTLTLLELNKARNGAILAVKEIAGQINFNIFLLMILVIIISGSIACIIGINISKKISNYIKKINYTKLIISIIILIIIISFILDNFMGVLIIIISTAIGIYCNLKSVPRNLMLGCINLQVILFFL
ncbi:hypothetical protein HOK68_01415 [Candidatus Woesearchaeota archaeon]|nr:hypothetical protein [Candidatus Woesearchaeota archaeon]MBT4387387.1 hypothetical protein [Candidatus Woesearchaeota archaeon]MBT4595525.1 hypothetical protein [Candidatus Woesearchaeota archaeon]MBT5740992.1 hypothetical protein [Candidatus Woesearchaeota archaeon]MBT6505419.1 hypothetical protein [Candidatus Woesearchaeota archaeon]